MKFIRKLSAIPIETQIGFTENKTEDYLGK